MRVITCLTDEHNLLIVLLAALVCIIGSHVTANSVRRGLRETGPSRYHWCFLAAVIAGSATWATHFIAMLGYQPNVPVTFDGPMTIFSALIAVVGIGIGLAIAVSTSRPVAAIVGGGTIGLSIAAMHYVGMFAYRVDGIVRWLPEYVVASLFAAVILAALATDRLRFGKPATARISGTALLVSAIVMLHFVGMAAFSVTPLPGVEPGIHSHAFFSMATAVALVALIIVTAGISTHWVDKSYRARSQDQLRQIALHDSLTGLANRHHFTEALRGQCEKLGEDAGFALLMVDLDRFKPVNDTLGHPVGDAVLRKVADRLRRATRKGDIVARIGGDEFAIIAPGMTEEREATAVADRVVDFLSRPFVIDGQVAELSASVGLALAPRDGGTGEALTQNVDVALYTAKRKGKCQWSAFDPILIEEIQRRRTLEKDLRSATRREDFEVVYQPVIDTISRTYTGAEALVRWHCPERGTVPPSEFIPIAEEIGLISRLGGFVLRRACEDAAKWPQELFVAVNLSPIQLLDPRLPMLVASTLNETGLAPHRLELEITETALLSNDEQALETLQKLRKLGVNISLDDFGTGYSSLSYLHRYPINRIKIDQSFVQKLPDDAGSASIVRAIAQLGASLGMCITAEGIETDRQLQFISDHGCDHVQGFLVGKPIAASEIGKVFGNTSKAAA